MGYTKDVIKGVSWIGAFRISTRIVSLIRTAIIARILVPSQVGVFGIASLVLSLIEIITETGVNIVLVQIEDKIDEYIDTAWVVSILRGVIICVCIMALSPFIAMFFRNSDALVPVFLIGFVPLLRGFINPSIVRFQKDLQFNKEFSYRTSLFFIESLATVIYTFILRAPIALVLGMITGAAAEVIISYFLISPRPHLRYHKEKFWKIVHSGKWITVAGVFNYLFYNGDNIVVGRMLGTSVLGLYDMAYRISILPVSEISDVIARVTFPVFTKISDDKIRLRLAFIKTVSLISLFCIPVCFMFYFFSSQLIYLILGPTWLSAAPILQILAVFGSIRAVSGSSGAVFLAVQKQEYITYITFAGLVILGILIVPFIYWFGVSGAALAALVAAIAVVPLIGYYLIKVLR